MALSSRASRASAVKSVPKAHSVSVQPLSHRPCPARRSVLARARVAVLDAAPVEVEAPIAAVLADVDVSEAGAPAPAPVAPGTRKVAAKPVSPGGRGQPIFVAGAEGQTAIRIVWELLGAGFKVVAGVNDVAAGRELAALAKRYELLPTALLANLSLQELDLSDGDLSAAALRSLPKRVPFVIVEGDTAGKGRSDGKSLQAALAVAEQQSASLVLLVSGAGGKGGGGGFFGGGGGGGGQASQSEKQVMASGLPYTIVRASGMDRPPPPTVGAATVAAVGSLVGAAAVTRSQVAQVVCEVLQQPPSRFGLTLEAGSLAAGEAAPLLVESLLEAISAIGAEAALRAPASSPPPPTLAAPKPALSLFGGTKRVAVKAQAEEAEEEEEAATPPKRAFSLFGGGTKRVAVAAPVEEEDEVVVVAPPKRAFGFFGDTQRGSVTAVQEEEEEEEEEEEAVPKQGFSFFGGGRAKAAPAAEGKKDVAVPAKGLFGLGTRQVKAAPPSLPAKALPAARPAARQQVAASRGAPAIKQAAGKAAPAAKQAAGKAVPAKQTVGKAASAPKQPLPFGVFAWGSAKEEEVEEEEEEAPPRWGVFGKKR